MSIYINKKEWKEIFREDMRQKLSESKIEFNKYKETKRVVFLQQAGNKLFSVVENWLMVKHNSRVSSFKDLRYLIRNDKNDRLLLSKVSQLHYFYYENIVRGDPEDFEELYLESYKTMRNRIK
jgi:hypothetical protein